MESVQLVHDLGNVFEKVISPAVSQEAEPILDAVLMFMRFYEQNEHFDLLTHRVGPGVVAVVMHNFSNFLGDLMGQKLVHRQKYEGKRLFPTMYMDKLRSIVNLIVVDGTDKYTGKNVEGSSRNKTCNQDQTRKPIGFMQSCFLYWFPCGYLNNTWCPYGHHMASMWKPCGVLWKPHSIHF